MNKKIAYVTDIHLDEPFTIDQKVDARKNWNIILDDISSRGIDEIILGGDIGEKTANKWFFESLQNYTIAITLGNHDDYNEVIKYYNDGVVRERGALYYSKELSYYKLLFLDSSSDSIDQEQFDWFTKELTTSKKIVLFIHHPILAVDAEIDKHYALKGRDLIKNKLVSFDNDVTIFCGHYHFEDKRNISNICQYITPASSYQVVKTPNLISITNKTFGYRIIELTKKKVHTNLVRFNLNNG
ncbi:metallophosphoesterase [Aquimarina sp. RZ0]|uniref:metallophosphoesterase family protein n=1 Tax=Aquimarina sp. RZ0 TaxID=2607730 RepID=UPI0011F37C7B|nr:metallophosphoesterase [Aquimarina sp. RZ0]KAA1244387.1 metallophosphoesterase [Aquimarina sp. RZ0]